MLYRTYCQSRHNVRESYNIFGIAAGMSCRPCRDENEVINQSE